MRAPSFYQIEHNLRNDRRADMRSGVKKPEIAAKIDDDAVTTECSCAKTLSLEIRWKEPAQDVESVPKTLKVALSGDLLIMARPFG